MIWNFVKRYRLAFYGLVVFLMLSAVIRLQIYNQVDSLLLQLTGEKMSSPDEESFEKISGRAALNLLALITKDLPDFKHFPVLREEIINETGPLAEPDLRNVLLGEGPAMIVSRLSGTVGVNFAGKYTVITWECGTSCQNGVVVDRVSGQVYRMPFTMENGYRAEKGSYLFVENPPENSLTTIYGSRVSRYYKWTGDELVPVGYYRLTRNGAEEIAVGSEPWPMTQPEWSWENNCVTNGGVISCFTQTGDFFLSGIGSQ